MKQELTQKLLKEHVNYDMETGVFTWKISGKGRRPVGERAGTKLVAGYRQIKIFGVYYLEHRLAHFYVTGTWPPHQVDHENRVRDDNRWKNLRLATRAENCQNITIPSHNTSGVIGVHFWALRQKWRAGLWKDGKYISFGSFDTFEEAVAARKAGELKHYTHSPLHVDTQVTGS